MPHFPTRVGFVLIAGVLVVAIGVATALVVSLQRSASIAAYSTATNNLGGGMARQTERSLGLIDNVLRGFSAWDVAAPGTASSLHDMAMRATRLGIKSGGAPRAADIVLIDTRGVVADASIGSPVRPTKESGSC